MLRGGGFRAGTHTHNTKCGSPRAIRPQGPETAGFCYMFSDVSSEDVRSMPERRYRSH